MAEHAVGPALTPGGNLVEGRERHAVAALCLHGQPFGFTREDVWALREIAMREQMEGDEVPGIVMSIADRIEALLPPEV